MKYQDNHNEGVKAETRIITSRKIKGNSQIMS